MRRVERPSPRLARVTLAGPELEGFATPQPAASVRLLLPTAGTSELRIPTWTGNEFLLPDGRRPTIRTFTPRHLDATALEIDLDVVLHGSGAASTWAAAASPGAVAAVSGPGRGYTVDPGARRILAAGDETALAAVAQLLETVPADVAIDVVVEVGRPEARLAVPDHPRSTVQWCDLPPGAPPGDALVAAVMGADVPEGTRVWAAGEAAAVQRIRRHLFEERGLPRAYVTVRGYWKHGRSGGTDDA